MGIISLNAIGLDGNIIIKKGGGGGATINNQDKVVDIAENGTTEVVADGGFTGLGKVTINTEVSGGGGADLEGEYFLAKPNGRYWKSKLASIVRGKYPAVLNSRDTFTNEQIESLIMYNTISGLIGLSGIGEYGGIPSHGREIYFFGNDFYARVGGDALSLQYEVFNYIDHLGAWQEGNITLKTAFGITFIQNGIVDIIKLTMEDDELSDAEALAIASEMLMMEQVTKEEYESWYNW